MMGMVEGTGRRGRSSREWLDDTRDGCQTNVHSLSLKAQDRKNMEKYDKKCIGHLPGTGFVPIHVDLDNAEDYIRNIK